MTVVPQAPEPAFDRRLTKLEPSGQSPGSAFASFMRLNSTLTQLNRIRLCHLPR